MTNEFLNSELSKIPWTSLKSTQPIRDRIQHLEHLLASAENDFHSQLALVDNKVDFAVASAGSTAHELATTLVVIKNARRNLQTPVSSWFNAIHWFILKRRSNRTRAILAVAEQLEFCLQKMDRLDSLRTSNGGRGTEKLSRTLEAIAEAEQALSAVPRGIAVIAKLEVDLEKARNRAILKFDEILKTVFFDPDSIPKKFTVPEINVLAASLKVSFPERLVHSSIACIEASASNTAKALKESEEVSGVIFISFLEFVWIAWKRFEVLVAAFSPSQINDLAPIQSATDPENTTVEPSTKTSAVSPFAGGDLILWSSASGLIVRLFQKLNLSSIHEEQQIEILGSIARFHALFPQKGLIAQIAGPFRSMAESEILKAERVLDSEIDDWIQSQGTLKLVQSFGDTCHQTILRYGDIFKCVEADQIAKDAIDRLTLRLVLKGLSLFSDWPISSSSDIYDAQERFLYKQRYFAVYDLVKRSDDYLRAQGPIVRPFSRSERNRFLVKDRLAWLECVKDGLSITLQVQLRESLSEYISERIATDLVIDAVTAWSNELLEVGVSGNQEQAVRYSRKFLSAAEKIGSEFPGLKRGLSRVVASQCLETLGLLVSGCPGEALVVESMQSVAIKLGGNESRARPSSGESLPSEEWKAVFDYAIALKDEKMQIHDTIEWCKNHGDIPLRILAALLSKKHSDVETAHAFEELEEYFTGIVGVM